ncbi:NUDIX domain-containing protein [Gorillibacterium sp. CAU 1737]|uniref:NUDIX hydrolase n=1 Tax=Gorillibacterium sp. CAU 1737 TaxID=3140362 RepID=UPI0032600E86
MASIIDKVAWILRKEDKILCARSNGKDLFYLPGGKREPGETDEETLAREILEEISVHILPETIIPMGAFEAEAHGKAHGTPVRMTCYEADYTGELKPDAEIAELAWLGYQDRERVSAVCQLVFDALHERGQL